MILGPHVSRVSSLVPSACKLTSSAKSSIVAGEPAHVDKLVVS